MSATQLAVFYATGSMILRRKVIPDDDPQLALHQPGPLLAKPYDDASCRLRDPRGDRRRAPLRAVRRRRQCRSAGI